jgi:hypothetical protein
MPKCRRKSRPAPTQSPLPFEESRPAPAVKPSGSRPGSLSAPRPSVKQDKKASDPASRTLMCSSTSTHQDAAVPALPLAVWRQILMLQLGARSDETPNPADPTAFPGESGPPETGSVASSESTGDPRGSPEHGSMGGPTAFEIEE